MCFTHEIQIQYIKEVRPAEANSFLPATRPGAFGKHKPIKIGLEET